MARKLYYDNSATEGCRCEKAKRIRFGHQRTLQSTRAKWQSFAANSVKYSYEKKWANSAQQQTNKWKHFAWKSRWKFNETRCHWNCFNVHIQSFYIRLTEKQKLLNTASNSSEWCQPDRYWTHICVCVRSMVYYLNVTFYSNRYMPLLYMYDSFHQLWIIR